MLPSLWGSCRRAIVLRRRRPRRVGGSRPGRRPDVSRGERRLSPAPTRGSCCPQSRKRFLAAGHLPVPGRARRARLSSAPRPVPALPQPRAPARPGPQPGALASRTVADSGLWRVSLWSPDKLPQDMW
ncbi:high mobility group nucleosome-binding domain-containing protein 4 isoform X1 [Canis lupus familiaris]|uniref:high mobility group nucleosome-binding domain-containing protein 4 isoform X1 n=1 Tax=Canis lupus familiaris TaxID=9615 RepID=UPI000DC6925D|nr:high mobility group nucleosome-binding domain-containing protein 4 isoform X1 [Canis lupus familiaris]XP_038302533.1 high mobility group nucleosome-binding domain-containing protein 4 isoform X1 [Canis lupus familiaris]XP_038302534.1 high mobility group nucleosome-binding domain-containing protein 4 isoform X1 [Canis lupus familiaris]XP_038318985.1 high mobility group nucleosome-binding domain-containing protein 4 isoform X1 [Canis lupus familiaris]